MKVLPLLHGHLTILGHANSQSSHALLVNRVGSLGRHFHSICAAALCAVPMRVVKGILFLIASFCPHMPVCGNTYIVCGFLGDVARRRG